MPPNKTPPVQPGTEARREFTLDRATLNDDSRTVELAFASETPYERWWGIEILDVSSSAMRTSRLISGGPLLMDHDARDHIGVIESVQIGADRVGRAVVRFGKSARAEEIYQDVKDGIRRNVSVGYMIHDSQLVSTKGDKETYRITDWEPMEVSLVAVPADASVGVGRSGQPDTPPPSPPVASPLSPMESLKMSETNLDDLRAAGASEAQKRVAEIIAIGKAYKCIDLASDYVAAGKSLDEFKSAVIEHFSTKPAQTVDIGMTKKEARNFSFVRALNALANPTDRKAQEAAQFERECSDAFGSKMGRAARGFYVPVEVQQRDLLGGTPTAGGNLVATNLLSQNFIELLRNKLALTGLGAQFLSGLHGQIAIPRQTGGATAYWVAESGAPTESQQAFDQVTMTPRTVGAFTDVSRKLLIQSSIDIESFIRNDLATVLALAIDLAAINGSGASNQPTGILNTAGIGSVAGGTNGLIPTWSNYVDLETAVAVANADVAAMGYLTNAKVRGRARQTVKVSGQGADFIWDDGSINGYNVGISNQVPSNLTKGTASGICSAIIFGNFNDLIIGQWSSLDLMVDPYTGSTSGTVRVVALQDVDVCIRHPESFAAMRDALT